MDKHKISVSFSKEYDELYNALKDMPNKSNFICKILSNNFKKYDDQNNLEEIIERAVIKALTKNGGVIQDIEKIKESDVSDEDRELINSLF